MMRGNFWGVIIAVVAIVVISTPAAADDLLIAQRAPVTSLDPHYQNYGPNMALAAHVFDRLIHQDDRQRLVPGLATEWRPVDDHTWTITLRRGVSFHDGSSFDAADVVASARRAARLNEEISVYTRGITKVEAIDPGTVRIETAEPWPLLPVEISQLPIIPAELERAGTAEFESGAAMIGTGPFRFEGRDDDGTIHLAANPQYWGRKSSWTRVSLRFMPDDAARITALASASVDMIDNVPPADVARLEALPQSHVAATPTSRVIYLGFDVRPDRVPPGTTAADGGALSRNPFLDVRVRRAVSLAINRASIVDGTMEGQAVAAGQLVPDYLFGAAPDLPPPPFDPATAKALLAAAGYPRGLRTELHCTRDRYVNDVQVCYAVALMLSGIGIEAKVSTHPSGDFFDRAAAGEFPLRLAGWGTGTGEASYTLKGLLVTRDAERGLGVSNYGGYSNPQLDALVTRAVTKFDDDDREAELQAAMDLAMQDLGVVPIHFQKAVWATRDHVRYVPRNDEFTLAIDVEAEISQPGR